MYSIIDVLPPNIAKVTFLHCTAGVKQHHISVLLYLCYCPSIRFTLTHSKTHILEGQENLSPFDLLSNSN